MGGLGPGLAVAGVVQHQHPVLVRRGRCIAQQQLQPPLVDPLVVPGRLGEKPLQLLHGRVLRADHGLGARERGQGLVAVAG